MPTTTSEDRFLSLDMLRISWVSADGRAFSECAILMEIWRSGAIFQTEAAIPIGSILTVAAPNGPVSAKVTTCTRDDYGFLITISVEPCEGWFPDSYYPADLIPGSSV